MGIVADFNTNQRTDMQLNKVCLVILATGIIFSFIFPLRSDAKSVSECRRSACDAFFKRRVDECVRLRTKRGLANPSDQKFCEATWQREKKRCYARCPR
jgi:hypothetical protein